MRARVSRCLWLPAVLLGATAAAAQVSFAAQPGVVSGPGALVQLQATFPPGHRATLMQFLDCGWFQILTPWGAATRGQLLHTVRPARTTRYRLHLAAPDGTDVTRFLVVRVGQPRTPWEAARWQDLETRPAEQLTPVRQHNLRPSQFRPSIQQFRAVRQVRPPPGQEARPDQSERGMFQPGTPSEESPEMGRQPRPWEPQLIDPGQPQGSPGTATLPGTPGVRILGEQVQLTIQVSGVNLIRVYGGSNLLWESPDLSMSGRTFDQTVSILTTTVYSQLVLRAANEAGVHELPCTPTTLLPDGSDPGSRLAPEIKE